MFDDMQDALCGKRGGKQFEYVKQAEIQDGEFVCPDLLFSCATNVGSSGKPYCVENKNDCPVTQLTLLDAKSLADSKLGSDQRFTVRQSSPGEHQMSLAFTKEGVETNLSLMNLVWAAWQPCAVTT